VKAIERRIGSPTWSARPTAACLASMLAELVPGSTFNARQQLGAVIRRAVHAGRLEGFEGVDLEWRWVGGAVDVSVSERA
jgi:hypothetical protein